MNGTAQPLGRRSLFGMLVLAAILGAVIFGLGSWLVAEITKPDQITGTSAPEGIDETEPSLDDAIHSAAEEAVKVDEGKLKGESLKIARIELIAGNPHITAYKVVLEPTD